MRRVRRRNIIRSRRRGDECGAWGWTCRRRSASSRYTPRWRAPSRRRGGVSARSSSRKQEGRMMFWRRGGWLLLASGALLAADAPTFEKSVQPILTRTCSPCHNEQLASGGLNIAEFTKASSLTQDREGWETILRKL